MTNLPADGIGAPESRDTPERASVPRAASGAASVPHGAHFAVDRETSGGHIDVLDALGDSSDGSPSGDDDQVIRVRRRRRRKRKERKGLRVAAIVIGALVVVGVLIVLVALGMIRSGEASFKGGMEGVSLESVESAVTYDEGRTVSYNGHSYALNEDMVSVVFIGFDRFAPAEGGEPAGQADVVMVMALDTRTGEMSVIAVPRDSMVDVDEFVGDAFIGQDTMQLCLSYSYGDGREQSCENTLTVVSRVLYGMPIAHYFTFNQSGIGPLNDAVGGVALTPLQTIPNTTIVEGESTILFGNDAYRYVQWRDLSQLDSSLARQARQMQYVKAFVAHILRTSEGNVGVLLDLFNVMGEHSITNLGVSEFSYLASTVLANDVTGLDVVTLDGEMVQGKTYAEYYLDKDAVYETVLEVYYRQVD